MFLQSHGVGTSLRSTHLQDLWRRSHRQSPGKPLQAGAGHPRHRLQDRRRAGAKAGHRHAILDPGASRRAACAAGMVRRRPLRCVPGPAGRDGRQAAGDPRNIIEQAIGEELTEENLVSELIDGQEALFLTPLYRAEIGCATNLLRLTKTLCRGAKSIRPRPFPWVEGKDRPDAVRVAKNRRVLQARFRSLPAARYGATICGVVERSTKKLTPVSMQNTSHAFSSVLVGIVTHQKFTELGTMRPNVNRT